MELDYTLIILTLHCIVLNNSKLLLIFAVQIEMMLTRDKLVYMALYLGRNMKKDPFKQIFITVELK